MRISSASWITDRIAIGNYLDARDRAFLSRNGFRSVLSLDGTLLNVDPEEFELEDIVVIPLKDGQGNSPATFRRAVMSLAELVEDFPPVLVQCHAGRSRSVIVVAGYLMKSLNIGPAQAIGMIKEKREINISNGLEDLLHSI